MGKGLIGPLLNKGMGKDGRYVTCYVGEASKGPSVWNVIWNQSWKGGWFTQWLGIG